MFQEHEKDVLDWAACVNDNKLVICYIHDVKVVISSFTLSKCRPTNKYNILECVASTFLRGWTINSNFSFGYRDHCRI